MDCSVSASWFLRDETNEEARKILTMVEDHELVVPPLWPIEMANVLVIAERKKRITAADAARVVELFLSLAIEVEGGGLQNIRVLQLLAREYGLTAYDACYLELAQEGIAAGQPGSGSQSSRQEVRSSCADWYVTNAGTGWISG